MELYGIRGEYYYTFTKPRKRFCVRCAICWVGCVRGNVSRAASEIEILTRCIKLTKINSFARVFILHQEHICGLYGNAGYIDLGSASWLLAELITRWVGLGWRIRQYWVINKMKATLLIWNFGGYDFNTTSSKNLYTLCEEICFFVCLLWPLMLRYREVFFLEMWPIWVRACNVSFRNAIWEENKMYNQAIKI